MQSTLSSAHGKSIRHMRVVRVRGGGEREKSENISQTTVMIRKPCKLNVIYIIHKLTSIHNAVVYSEAQCSAVQYSKVH